MREGSGREAKGRNRRNVKGWTGKREAGTTAGRKGKCKAGTAGATKRATCVMGLVKRLGSDRIGLDRIGGRALRSDGQAVALQTTA